jgi:hypothetical protein
MTKVRTLAAATALAVAIGGPADAATYVFTYSGDASASWRLPSSPTPSSFSGNAVFSVTPVNVTFNGDDYISEIFFFDSTNLGGFSIIFEGSVLLNAAAEQLFTGTTEAPVFRTGTFATTPYPGLELGNGTLTIANAVPEPGSWALLIAGFGLTGAVLRRRRSAVPA